MVSKKEEVWNVIHSLNEKWSKGGNINELGNYFHENVILVSPDGSERYEGREILVESFKSFLNAAKIHSFEESDPEVRLFGNNLFAVVTYSFRMTYEMGGKTITEVGKELLTLLKESEKWWIITRSIFSHPGK